MAIPLSDEAVRSAAKRVRLTLQIIAAMVLFSPVALLVLTAENRYLWFLPVEVRAAGPSDAIAKRYVGFSSEDMAARNIVVVSGPFSKETSGLSASLFLVRAGAVTPFNTFTVGRSRNRIGSPTWGWLDITLALGEGAGKKDQSWTWDVQDPAGGRVVPVRI